MTAEKATVHVLDDHRQKTPGSMYEFEGTGEELASLRQRVDVLEKRIDEVHEHSKEKASPENLYQSVGVGPIAPHEYLLILKIRTVLSEGLEHLKKSLSEPEEILRESYIDLFFNHIRRLTFYSVPDVNFKDSLTALTIALKSHVTEVYSQDEIRILITVSNLLRDNIFMSEDVLHKCLDILDSFGFDLSFPFKEVNFNE